MNDLAVPVLAARPTVWCDWYQRPAHATRGVCDLCKSTGHRPLAEAPVKR